MGSLAHRVSRTGPPDGVQQKVEATLEGVQAGKTRTSSSLRGGAEATHVQVPLLTAASRWHWLRFGAW